MKFIGNLSARRAGRACLAAIAALECTGIVIGSVIAAGHSGGLPPWLHQFFLPDADISPLRTFARGILSVGGFAAAAFFLGLFALGQPLGLLLAVYRGIGIGASAACMYALLGKEAVLPVMLLITPKAVTAMVITMLAVRELMRSSNALLVFTLTSQCREDKHRSFRLYCIKFIVLIIISLAAAALDTALRCVSAYLL